jgi:hypothetical protein
MQVNHKRVLRMMREDNLAGCEATAVRRHDGLEAQLGGLSQSGESNEADGDGPPCPGTIELISP